MLIMQEIIYMFMKRISSDAIIIWYRQALHTPSIMHITKKMLWLYHTMSLLKSIFHIYTLYIIILNELSHILVVFLSLMVPKSPRKTNQFGLKIYLKNLI